MTHFKKYCNKKRTQTRKILKQATLVTIRITKPAVHFPPQKLFEEKENVAPDEM